MQIASIFETIIIYIVLWATLGVSIFPLSQLNTKLLILHDRNPAYWISSLLIYAAFVVILRKHISGVFFNLMLLFKQGFLGIYVGLVSLSIFWSNDFFLTLKGISAFLLVSIFAVYLGRRYNWQELSRLLRWNCLIIALASMVTAVFVPSVGQGSPKEGWNGIFVHPNGLGALMAFGALLWLLNFLQDSKHRWRSLGFFIVSIIVMQFANSAGAFVAFMASTTILILLPLIRRLNFAQAVIFFALFLLIVSGVFIGLIANFRSEKKSDPYGSRA